MTDKLLKRIKEFRRWTGDGGAPYHPGNKGRKGGHLILAGMGRNRERLRVDSIQEARGVVYGQTSK